MSAQQKALFLDSVQGQFTVREAPKPIPGPGDLLIRVEAAALNPVDWKTQAEGFFLVTVYPVILGTDGAGTVEELGEGVIGFSKGDKV